MADGYETDGLCELVDDIVRRLLNDSAHDRCVRQRFDRELWHVLDHAGLTKLTSEFGARPVELAVVLYALARHAAVVPLAETDMLAGWLAREAGYQPPDGPLTIAIVDGDELGARIKGAAVDVPWTREAGAVVLAVRTPGRSHVAIVSNDEVDTEEGHNLAGEPRNTLKFDLPAERFVEVSAAAGEELARRGAWARCVQIVGALDAAAEHSFAHTRARVQFGRTLNSFQSVQHSLAAMVGEIERSRAVVALAVAAATDFGFAAQRTRYATALAKVVLGQTVSAVTTRAHQLHGAIGVTIEHPLWRFTMRAQSWVGEYGSAAHYARQLGGMVLDAANPWDIVLSGQAVNRRRQQI
ncbi:acyl-CoA dehydrogenase [Mycobacterium palustre]|uniref:Acyl-CoA dehydrogenase n=1 Tax=Mycobacterium palustre TaxID=153971 RepID=A0A1X1ZVX2_9MYCO|nr:acyl-CoA dehydrogenase [Mycobacterium palustre]ORW28283.1 acyl-CoA dehydrogenase [Mycobacterium palustre]